MIEGKSQHTVSPLEGVRVIDLSRVIAGPWCAQILADYGADVIKVEHPVRGDDSRAWAPPMMRDKDGRDLTESVSFSACNRGKRSIALDISDPAMLEQLRRLIVQADVLIENFKFGGLKKYGLDYAALSCINPSLIYCSFTGYGQTGPYRERPGYDTIMQGLCGYMSLTGHPDDSPGGGPLKMGLPVIDILSGVYGATAILAALRKVEAGGKGQHIDISLMDVGVSTLGHMALGYLSGNSVPIRRGNRLPMVYPSDAFQCRDGWVMIIAGNNNQFARLCDALDISPLATDPRFDSNVNRIANVDALHAELSAAARQMSVSECIARCSQAGVPCGPINDVAQVFEDEHVRARGLASSVTHRHYGEVPTVANPVRFSTMASTSHHAPPTLGEHTEEVLDALSISGEWPSREAEKEVVAANW